MLAEAEAISAAYAGPGGVRQENKIVVMLGAPAAGKSTIAEQMAPEMGARIVDADEVYLGAEIDDKQTVVRGSVHAPLLSRVPAGRK